MRWNPKKAGCGEPTNPWTNLWFDEQKSHIRPCMRVRLQGKSKPDNYTEFWADEAAFIMVTVWKPPIPMTGTEMSEHWKPRREKMSCSPLHTGMTATETARRRQAHRQLWAASLPKSPQGIMRWISPMLMMSGDSFWKSGGTALLFAVPMTKPGTESGRRMHREKSVISIMRRTS